MASDYAKARVQRILDHVDNPANEDGWGLAIYIAKRAGVSSRGIGATLAALERQGFVESRLDKPERIYYWRLARERGGADV